LYNQIAKRYEYEDNLIENDLPILIHKYQIPARNLRQLDTVDDYEYLIDDENKKNKFIGNKREDGNFFLSKFYFINVF
jgi:hypothetical protein